MTTSRDFNSTHIIKVHDVDGDDDDDGGRASGTTTPVTITVTTKDAAD